MNYPIEIHYPSVTNSAKLSAKESKYRSCLQMVAYILRQELSIETNDTVFNLFADVASKVDDQLDSISLEHKLILKQQYDSLADELLSESHFIVFQSKLCKHFEQLGIDLGDADRNINPIFDLVQFCSNNDLLSELKCFGEEILHAAIYKHQALTSSQVIAALQMEGSAANRFLQAFIAKVYQADNNHSVFLYLTSLEKMLNLADDFLDVSKDRRAGLLSSRLPFFHRFLVGMELVKTSIHTWFKFPVKLTNHFIVFTFRFNKALLSKFIGD